MAFENRNEKIHHVELLLILNLKVVRDRDRRPIQSNLVRSSFIALSLSRFFLLIFITLNEDESLDVFSMLKI
jgi:hypothetical protein